MIQEVRWDITGKCNLNCTHCQAMQYYRKRLDKKDLITEEIFVVVDRLKRAGIRKIGLLGGEPLLREDLLIILQYMRDSGMQVSLNTNLLLLERYDIDELVKNLKSIFVSLDGIMAEEHEALRGKGTFNKTIENIKILSGHASKIPVDISYVINRNNFQSTERIYDFMKTLGVKNCLIDVVHKVGNASDNWDSLALSMEQEIDAIKGIVNSWDYSDDMILNLRMYSNKFRDFLETQTGVHLDDKLVWDAPGKTSVYILNDGTVVPTQFMAYLEDDKFQSKSLKDYELTEILNSKGFADFLELYDRKLPQTYYEPCRNCQYCGKQCNPSPVSYWLGKKTPIDLCTGI